MTSSSPVRKSLGILFCSVVALFLTVSASRKSQVAAPKPAANPRLLWTYDTGG